MLPTLCPSRKISRAELDIIHARRADTHKLGLALHIGFLRLSGRLPDAKRMVSATLWRHLGAQLGVASPELASLKAPYAREATLMEHLRMACDVLEFTWMSEHRLRALVLKVRDEVARSGDTNQPLRFARHWIYEHKLLIPDDRALRSIITNTLSALERETADAITTKAVLLPLVITPKTSGSRITPQDLHLIGSSPHPKSDLRIRQIDSLHLHAALSV